MPLLHSVNDITPYLHFMKAYAGRNVYKNYTEVVLNWRK
jgi:hypothetical protein